MVACWLMPHQCLKQRLMLALATSFYEATWLPLMITAAPKAQESPGPYAGGVSAPLCCNRWFYSPVSGPSYSLRQLQKSTLLVKRKKSPKPKRPSTFLREKYNHLILHPNYTHHFQSLCVPHTSQMLAVLPVLCHLSALMVIGGGSNRHPHCVWLIESR